jgi:hypothetical protein
MTQYNLVDIYKRFGGAVSVPRANRAKKRKQIFDPEDGSNIFLRNVGKLLPD